MIPSRPLETDRRLMAKSTPTQRQVPATPPSAPSKALQVFANPAPQRDYTIRFAIDEFTCLCPLTGSLISRASPSRWSATGCASS